MLCSANCPPVARTGVDCVRVREGPGSMNTVHRHARLAFIAVLYLCFSGASGQANLVPAHAASQRTAVTVRVGYLPIADFLGLYTAFERGFFRGQGLNLVLTPILSAGTTILPAMEGGSLDLGITNSLTAILATSHGLQPTFVTRGLFEVRGHPAHAIIVMKRSSIHRAKDLEGKLVAVNSLQSIEHISMEQWLQDHGGSAARTRFAQISFANMVPALVHGQVDAALAAEPGLTIALSEGARILGYQYTDERSRTFVGGVIALRPWAASHSDIVRRFASAYTQGVLWAMGHNTVARTRYLPKYTHLPAAIASKIRLPGASAPITVGDLTFWVRLGIRWHVLSHAINVKQLIWPTASH
jgi:NitT/TauT family transport system substrate-binding protein